MIDEEQAKVVRQVFNLYLKVYSVDGIIKYLATKNIKTPPGKNKWTKRAIKTMLCNENI